MGARVVVIGGGNVALDVARTAARGGEQENLQRNLSVVQALDVARSAIRFGAREVTVCCLESESEMPAAPEEIDEARREGIHFRHRRRPEAPRRRGRRRDGRRVSRRVARLRRDGPLLATVRRGLGDRLPDRHRHRRDRADRGLLLPAARRTGSRRAGGASSIDPDTLATTRSGRLRGGRRRVRAPHRDQRRRRREARRPFDRRASSGAGRARSPRSRSRSTCTIATSGTLDFEGIPRQKPPTRPISRRIGIAEVEECFGGARGAARGHALPPLLDEHDLRGGPRGGDRVHPLRRLPGHLPGGLHRDPPVRPA